MFSALFHINRKLITRHLNNVLYYLIEFNLLQFSRISQILNDTKRGQMTCHSYCSKSTVRKKRFNSWFNITWHWVTLTRTHTHTHWMGELILATCPVWWILPVSHLNYHQGNTLPLSDPPKLRCSSSGNSTTILKSILKILHLRTKMGVFAPCICIFKDEYHR